MTPPLTKLTEEEELFRDTVRDFAEREVRPRVAAMERASAVDPALLAKCFELGLMGIDIPESHRSEEHTSELQSQSNLVCRLLLEKKKKKQRRHMTRQNAQEERGHNHT